MEQRAPHWVGRSVQKRVERRGMTPRLAASLIAAFWAIGVVVFGIVERLVNPDTFDNVWLGMWWGVQTVTTVGYGDVVPGNTTGKVIASLLMFGGLSLFAVVTGAITSAFVAQAQERMQAGREDPVENRLDEIAAQLEAIKAELARLK
jgi:voltage-gated potassium channel